MATNTEGKESSKCFPPSGLAGPSRTLPFRPLPVMCKHILNAQVSIRAACCKRWFDCPECHAEATDHELKKSVEIVMACKKCKKCFRKDTSCVSCCSELGRNH